MHLRILNLDDSLAGQEGLAAGTAWQSVATLDLRDLGERLRLWARASTIDALRKRLGKLLPPIGPTVHLLGSGDFHHLAAVLLEAVDEPVTVVHFDNHPDWVRLAPRWHCGSWVNQALRLNRVKRVVTIGPCSDDLVRPELKGGNLAALGRGTIVLFPWSHAPSRVWRRVPDGPGHHHEPGYLSWHNLIQDTATAALSHIIEAIPTDAIWLSIDKDVLPDNEVLTNWDQGRMPLESLTSLMQGILNRKRLIGADICGDYAPPAFRNLLKRIEARRDQPQRSMIDATALARNAAVNRRLLTTIAEAAPC